VNTGVSKILLPVESDCTSQCVTTQALNWEGSSVIMAGNGAEGPGNMRESIILNSSRGLIGIADLPERIRDATPLRPPTPWAGPDSLRTRSSCRRSMRPSNAPEPTELCSSGYWISERAPGMK